LTSFASTASWAMGASFFFGRLLVRGIKKRLRNSRGRRKFSSRYETSSSGYTLQASLMPK
jgi:hypothetical protein